MPWFCLDLEKTLMGRTKNPPPTWTTMADLLLHLGEIPPDRVRLEPVPGTATEKDVLRVMDQEDRLCELVDGVLVEKAMGFLESGVAIRLGRFLDAFAEDHDLGIVVGADGTVRLMRGLVRIPDVAFVSYRQLPERCFPEQAIPDLAPDLAVEVLSDSNTPAEIQRKLKEYFLAGVRLVWVIDPDRRTAQVYTAPDRRRDLAADGVLEGEDVLPGFRLPPPQLFARLKPLDPGTRRTSKRRKS